MPKTLYVYILASRTRVLYVGVTNNLERRLAEHRSSPDRGSRFAKRYGVHQLVHCEAHVGPMVAIRREKQIKSWSRWRKVRLIEARNPGWIDLWPADPHGPCGASG